MSFGQIQGWTAAQLLAGGVIGAGAHPVAAGDDLGDASRPFDAWLRHAAYVEGAGPTLGTDKGFVFCLTGGDIVVAPETGGTAGLRVVDPNAPSTNYLRLRHSSSFVQLDVAGAGYVQWPEMFCNELYENYDGGGFLRYGRLTQYEISDPGGTANFSHLYAADESSVTAHHARFSGRSVRFAKDLAPVAITQTYSTTASTHAAMTSADISAFTGGSVGFLNAAERDDIRTQVNALRADVINVKGVLNLLIDAVQAQTSFVS